MEKLVYVSQSKNHDYMFVLNEKYTVQTEDCLENEIYEIMDFIEDRLDYDKLETKNLNFECYQVTIGDCGHFVIYPDN